MTDFIIDIINYLIAGIGAVLSTVLALFPDTPFQNGVQPPEGVVLSWIAWLIPYNKMAEHLVLMATAVLSYYFIRVLARWVKVVRS